MKNYPEFSDLKKEKRRRFQIVIGVAEGDVHDLGKNIVVAVLDASGYCDWKLKSGQETLCRFPDPEKIGVRCLDT